MERRLTAVDKQKRDGTLHRAPLVYVMHVQFTESFHLYGAREHGECVELTLMSAPVISVPPSFGEPPDVCERNTIRPVGVADFIRKSGVVKLSAKNGKRLVHDRNLKGLLVCHDEWG